MRRGRPRPGVLAGVATVALLALTACGSDTDGHASAGDGEDTLRMSVDENAFRAEPDIAGVTSMSLDARFDKVEDSDRTRVLAPGVDLRITGVARLDTLDVDVYADLGGNAPSVNDEGEPIEEVYPAEGQAFFAVEYSSDDPQWEPRGDIPDSVASVVINGNDVAEVFSTADGTMQRGTIVASLPADSAPDAAVLEVETAGKFQSLSLLNGKRVNSDVEHIYDVVDRRVEIGKAEEFEETFTGWAGGTKRIAGSVVDAFATPWLDRGNGGDGWAGPGKTYLSVEVDWVDISGADDDESTVHLELDNGKTVQPDNDPSSLVNAFDDNAVFQIPATTQHVTVVVTPQVKVGAGSGAKVHKWDPVKAELTIAK